MEIEITYRGQSFEIRAERREDDPEAGEQWTEAVAVLGGVWERVAWDGSGIRYGSAIECVLATVKSVIETVEDNLGDPAEWAEG